MQPKKTSLTLKEERKAAEGEKAAILTMTDVAVVVVDGKRACGSWGGSGLGMMKERENPISITPWAKAAMLLLLPAASIPFKIKPSFFSTSHIPRSSQVFEIHQTVFSLLIGFSSRQF